MMLKNNMKVIAFFLVVFCVSLTYQEFQEIHVKINELEKDKQVKVIKVPDPTEKKKEVIEQKAQTRTYYVPRVPYYQIPYPYNQPYINSFYYYNGLYYPR
jgi:hypothetical protein